jgi:hypothetical protein
MKKPFFSLIIPALNESRYLPHLLADLSRQTYRDFEVIVVDGHSSDQTVAKAETFKSKLPKLTILTSPKRHVCTQRNLGAKVALANIFIFSDADNRFPPYFLQGLKYRWESEGVEILSPFITPDIMNPQNKMVATSLNLYIDLQTTIKPKFLLESCVVVSKKCFDAVGGFDASIDYSEGVVFLEKATKLDFKIKVIKDPTYSFSFRRNKKYGTAKVVTNAIGIQLMDLLGFDQNHIKLSKLYPMLGGSVYNNQTYKIKKNKVKKFLNNIQKLLKDF